MTSPFMIWCVFQKVVTEMALEIQGSYISLPVEQFIESEIILEVLFSNFRNYKSNFLMLGILSCFRNK